MDDRNENPDAVTRAGASGSEQQEHGRYKLESNQRLAVVKNTALALIRHSWSEVTTTFNRDELCRRDAGYAGALRGAMGRAILKAIMLLGQPRQPRVTDRERSRMKTELVRTYRRAYCGCGKRADGATVH